MGQAPVPEVLVVVRADGPPDQAADAPDGVVRIPASRSQGRDAQGEPRQPRLRRGWHRAAGPKWCPARRRRRKPN
eukprot:12075938-Alexandrium_andersonii.AAC.1